MPSPSQFDHVITVVPRGPDLLWMDSTAEVAPFRLLSFPLRDKSALLVPVDGKGKIVHTPVDPPFPSTQAVSIEGSVSDLGKLNGTLHYSLRGDQEFVLRLAFRRTPQSQWKDIGSTILHLDGLNGLADSVTTSDPSDTGNPFELTIEFSEPNFLVWSSKKARVSLPLLSIGMPDPPRNEADPIRIGSPLGVTTRLQLTLPPTFKTQAPIAVAVNRDYADFKSTYAFDGHTVSASRTLNFKMRELPADRASDYVAFTHAVQADAAQTLLVENSVAGAPEIPDGAKPEELLEAANSALGAGNPQAAIPLYQRVVELQPDHKQAWNQLGLSYMRVGQRADAIAAFRKQLDVNPYDEHSNDYLGMILAQQQKYDEAATAFRKQLEINPLDPAAHLSLGEMLLEQHKYAEAIPELDKASSLLPDNPGVEVNLGRAYLNTGEKEKALEAFDKATDISQTPFVWNNIAYDLADAKVELDKAQQYAESAVTSTSADLRNVALAHLTIDQLGEVASIANYWDTLGWVYFQQSDLTKAGRYIRSSWLLSQRGEVADHLAQVYEKQGNKDRAANMYAMAMAAPHSVPETRSRLMLVLGGNEKISSMVTQAQSQLAKQRTYPVGKLLTEKAEAVFEFLLSPSGADGAATKIDSVVFIAGSEKLRPFADQLHATDFGAMFPDASPIRLVRRGTLACSASGDCSLTLIAPEDIHTLP
jgi:tetratricopeptide (TPR) repeat protein